MKMVNSTGDESTTKNLSPGPFIQYINHLLNKEPTSFLFRGFFWFFVLSTISPLLGVFIFFQTLYQCVQFLLAPRSRIDARTDGKVLAVYITGCDTGFGRSLTFLLAERGFTVFCACLTETGMKQFEGVSNVYPLKVDVTKEGDIIEAFAFVSNWLKQSTSTNKRFLHAIINNAGIGISGNVDWNPLSNYKQVMDVNYFGTIRTTKSFLPILKEQASTGSYKYARIINIVSIAGLTTLPGSSTYFCSKHAIEAFSSCLRTELAAFNMKVVSLNPSFHATNMVETMGPRFKKLWENVQPEIKDEYGEDYFQSSFRKAANIMIRLTWNASVVEEQLVMSVEHVDPDPRVVVGSDAKYAILVFRLVPKGLRENITLALVQRLKPAKMIK